MLNSMTGRRRAPALLVVGLALVSLGTACWQVRSPNTLAPAAPSPVSGGADYGTLPGSATLSVDQKLDRALSLPGMRALLRGAIGAGVVSRLPSGVIVTDHPLRITEVRSRLPQQLEPGEVVTLRSAGGCLGNLCGRATGSPSVAGGQDVFVFYRDQGTYLGGNAAGRIVVSSDADVLTVRDGTVVGQGDWHSFREPLDRFLAHFEAAPS
jgi:hypothetical protein